MEQEENKKKNDTRKRVNIGARTGMIAPVVSLGCTAIIAIHTYRQEVPFLWWLLIFFGSLAAFLFIGSILQTVVELAVERAIDREEEEKRLRELELLHAIEGAGEGEEGSETMGAATET
ncbi:MAG: hypothetical protein IK016_07235 [Lachnospiraceae bacterium]|nr:hypothetical protein [Lachnospiraceae bacterium]